MPVDAVPLPSQLISGRPGVRARPVVYGIVGHGWRADFYFRLARQAPDRFVCAGAVTRRSEVGEQLEADWGIPTFRRPEDLLKSKPDVVVTCVPRTINAEVVKTLVGADTTVLTETPPASDVQALRLLWSAVGDRNLVQVAEQHPFLPHIAALRELIAQGPLGQVTSAQISWTHDYHAIAVLRCLLGVGGEPARVSTIRTGAPLLAGPDRTGWPESPRVESLDHVLSIMAIAGRTGVYDFTEGQWFNPLRRRHLIVRASRGEVVGDQVVWGGADGRPIGAPIVRRQSGIDGNLEGGELETLSWTERILYRNPYPGSRMSDEEIAIATCLEATGMWSRGEGPPPYPLAHACQDHLLALHLHEAAERAAPVTSHLEPWAAAITAAETLGRP